MSDAQESTSPSPRRHITVLDRSSGTDKRLFRAPKNPKYKMPIHPKDKERTGSKAARANEVVTFGSNEWFFADDFVPI